MKTPSAEIVMIGSELLLGELQDTNATYLARTLAEAGIPLLWKTTVGDNLARIAAALRHALSRSDIVLCSGGLGPTEDDLTREALAALMGVPLVYHPAVMEAIESRFARLGRKITGNNRKQAMAPDGVEIIPNPNGTAPGLWARLSDKVVVCMPGVPFELKPMFQESILPRICQEFGFSGVIRAWNLRVCGMGESRIDALIGDLIERSENPKIGLLAGPEGVIIRISARAGDASEAERMISPLADRIQERLGGIAFGKYGEQVEDVLAEQLRKRNLKLVVHETVTGGEICRRMMAAGADVLLQGRVEPPEKKMVLALDTVRNMVLKWPFACALAVIGSPDGEHGSAAVAVGTEVHTFELPYFGEGRLLQTRLAVAALEETRRLVTGLVTESGT